MATQHSINAIASAGRDKFARRLKRVFRASRYDWLAYLCWIVGAAALGWVLYVSAYAYIFQAVQSRHLAALRSETVAPRQLRTGELIGKLTIPRIGLSDVVLEGDDDATLRRAVGHIPGTSLPDGSGTVGLAAHRDTFFRNLGRLRPNQEIDLETPAGTYRYRVMSTAIVDPANVEVLRPQGHQALALVTCYPFHYIGPAPRRYVITAWRIPEAQPNQANGGRDTAALVSTKTAAAP